MIANMIMVVNATTEDTISKRKLSTELITYPSEVLTREIDSDFEFTIYRR